MRGALVPCFVATASLVASNLVAAPATDTLRVIVFNVGQGNCVLVRCPTGQFVLVDCGARPDLSADDTETLRNAIRSFLGQPPTLETLIISHPDADHFNLIDRVLDGVAVGRILIGGQAQQYDEEIAGWWAGLRVPVLEFPRPYFGGTPRDDLASCGVSPTDGMSIIGVNTDTGNSNGVSVVVKFRLAAATVVLPGDATMRTENVIGSFYGDVSDTLLRSTMLLAAHHGSRYANTPGWVTHANPQLLAFSARSWNYGHPRCLAIELYSAQPTRLDNTAMSHWIGCYAGQRTTATGATTSLAVYSTADTGTLVFTTDGANYRVDLCGLNLQQCSPTVAGPVRP